MKKDYQEHELTAYLVNELDYKRREEIAEILKNSESAREKLEELQETMQGLCEALADEPAITLSAEQRRQLATEFEKTRPIRMFRLRFPRSRFVRWSSGLAAAASLVVVLVLSWETAKQPMPPSPVQLQMSKEVQRVEKQMAQQIEKDAARQVEAREKYLAPTPGGAGGQVAVSDALLKTEAEGQKERRQYARDGKSKARTRESAGANRAAVAPTTRPDSAATHDFNEKGTSAYPGIPIAALPVPAASTGTRQTPATTTITIDEAKSVQTAPPTSPYFRQTSGVVGGVAGGVVGGVVKGKPGAGAGVGPGGSGRYSLMPGNQEEEQSNTEAYDYQADNEMTAVAKDPLSTFSIDVDTASYSNVRRFLREGQLPPPDAVRIEEMINYFPYDYEPPHDGRPFAVATEVAQAPWAPDHRLVRIALKGRELPSKERPDTNLVFLLDVSGSMESPLKLPLVKQAMRLLVDKLENRDRVAIVVYAGSSGLVLPSTSGADKQRILDAIEQLEAGGSTNGASGIQLAYREAQANFRPDRINRVILATDGDFNVGITNQGDLVRLVQEEAAKGIYLTALGFGMGNYKDSMLEKLADKGNGNYAYIDSVDEARKVLVEQIGGTLVTIAKDVKIQVEFNPLEVTAYRLIGYENRVMAHQDFDNDRKDAGEIGAGHTVTALYEVVPAGVPVDLPQSEPLKYQRKAPGVASRGELLTVNLRYKMPNEETSRKLEVPVIDSMRSFDQASDDFRFAAAVAGFGMVLRNSPFKGSATFQSITQIADTSRHFDPQGYRAEFVRLIGEASRLAGKE